MTTTEHDVRVSGLVVKQVSDLFTDIMGIRQYVHSQPNNKHVLVQSKVSEAFKNIQESFAGQPYYGRQANALVTGLLVTFGVCAHAVGCDRSLTITMLDKLHTHLNNLLRAGGGGGAEV